MTGKQLLESLQALDPHILNLPIVVEGEEQMLYDAHAITAGIVKSGRIIAEYAPSDVDKSRAIDTIIIRSYY